MSIFLVNQGKTYKYERGGQYIWSPKHNKAGDPNKGYNLMQSVKKGDFIIHNSGRKLSAISIVQEGCKSGSQPKELKDKQNEYEWNDDGWIIKTKYYDFEVPLLTADLTTWARANYKSDTAFQVNGKLRLQYLCNLDKSQAAYLIQKALGFETNPEVIEVLQAALKEVDPAAKVVPAQPKGPEGETKEAPFNIDLVKEQTIVKNQNYGEGTVTRIADGKIYIDFEGRHRIFLYPDAFYKGWLTI